MWKLQKHKPTTNQPIIILKKKKEKIETGTNCKINRYKMMKLGMGQTWTHGLTQLKVKFEMDFFRYRLDSGLNFETRIELKPR